MCINICSVFTCMIETSRICYVIQLHPAFLASLVPRHLVVLQLCLRPKNASDRPSEILHPKDAILKNGSRPTKLEKDKKYNIYIIYIYIKLGPW